MTIRDSSLPAVAQVVPTLVVGGAEMLAVRLAGALAAAGHRSFLYVLAGEGPLDGRIDPAVAVRRLRVDATFRGDPLAVLAKLVRGTLLLSRAAARDRIDVLQTHLPAANYLGLLVGRDRRPAIPTIHNNRELAFGEAPGRGRLRLRRTLYRAMLRRCPATVAVSEAVRAALLEDLGLADDPAASSRLVVVPNGVVVPEPLSPEERRRVRERHGAGVGEPLIVAAGRLTEQKDPLTLVRALALLDRQGRPFRAVLAGEGPLRPEVELEAAPLLAAGRLALPGNLADLQELMLAADVFVTASRWEGRPLALLEAMACGLPVAGTAIPGVAELIGDGQGGRLCPAGDPAALARSLDVLLTDPDLRARLGAGGRELVRDRHSLAAMVDRLRALYGRCRLVAGA